MSSMRNAMTKAAAIAADLLPDALHLIGAGLVSYGAYMIYAPAGFIVGGSFFILAGRLAARSMS